MSNGLESMYVTIVGNDYLLGFAGVAKFLNTTTKQVETWYVRRGRNGFPDPLLIQIPTAGAVARERKVWEPELIAAWRASYRPAGGGIATHRPGCACNAHTYSDYRQLTLW